MCACLLGVRASANRGKKGAGEGEFDNTKEHTHTPARTHSHRYIKYADKGASPPGVDIAFWDYYETRSQVWAMMKEEAERQDGGG